MTIKQTPPRETTPGQELERGQDPKLTQCNPVLTWETDFLAFLHRVTNYVGILNITA